MFNSEIVVTVIDALPENRVVSISTLSQYQPANSRIGLQL